MLSVLFIGLVVTIGKFIAWNITHSNAILTDALESIINIIAASFGLFTVIYAARPSDENHPYGHGKMEYFAVGFEGGMIFLAGISMIIKAVYSLLHPITLHEMDTGIYITVVAALVNLGMGRYLMIHGKNLNSSTLVADGQHLLSDTWSSFILLAGLLIIYFTGLTWMDAVLTILLGSYILYVGYRLLRKSMAGLMDEADFIMLDKIVGVLNEGRRKYWIDVHNLRVVKYGAYFHIDMHLTLPWYLDLNQSHSEVKEMEALVNRNFGNRVELFIHTDPCKPESCPICLIFDCPVRQHPFIKKLEWTTDLLQHDKAHHLS